MAQARGPGVSRSVAATVAFEAGLTRQESRCFILHVEDGRTYEEIAVILQVKPITVHSYMSRAMARVRAEVERQAAEQERQRLFGRLRRQWEQSGERTESFPTTT